MMLKLYNKKDSLNKTHTNYTGPDILDLKFTTVGVV